MADFSNDHLGKRVVAQNGSTVGEVTDVRDGSLWVTVDADVEQDVLDSLEWDGVVSQETQELPDTYVSKVREETIRLRV